jgi:solute carrier family 25 aspartate/glutamate transporter 12/13
MSADTPQGTSRLSAIKSTTNALIQPAQSELTRWKRTFDKFASVEVDGTK